MARKSKRSIKNSQSYKKELKLAFGIDKIIDHVTIVLQTMYGEGVKRFEAEKTSTIQMVVPNKWKVHTCEVS